MAQVAHTGFFHVHEMEMKDDCNCVVWQGLKKRGKAQNFTERQA